MADHRQAGDFHRDLEVARLVRARRAVRMRTRARFPAQRLLDCLQGRCVPAPRLEQCRKCVEALRGVLARADIPPDAPDLPRQLALRRRPDLSSIPGAIQRAIADLLDHARPLAPGSFLQDGEDAWS